MHTSLISLILEPPLPIREPHWLPGITRRRVTGGLLVTLLFAIAAVISCGGVPEGEKAQGFQGLRRVHFRSTSFFESHALAKSSLKPRGKSCVCLCVERGLFRRSATDLLKPLGDHGEGPEEALCGACDGDDPLRGRAFGDVNASSTLEAH